MEPLTLSRHPTLSDITSDRSSRLHPVTAQNWHMQIFAGQPMLLHVTYTDACGNIVNTIIMSEHTSLEKYTSHTLFEMVTKGLCVRDELETEQTATYWPPVPLSFAALLSCSAGLLNRGSWRPIARWVLVLSTASYLQLWL